MIDLFLTVVTYVVQPGDSLSSIGDKEGYAWVEIYNHNRDVIDDPNMIFEGMVLTMPESHDVSLGFSPNENTVVVMSGQTLDGIASQHGMGWRELYALNTDTISDPNIIFDGQILRLS